MSKTDRLKSVNELVEVISSCGRRFFFSKTKGVVASVEIDQRGRVWWNDDYSGKRIYTHYPYRWRGFTHGGTLKHLVMCLRDFVCKGQTIPPYVLGPWPEHYCNGDLWGYGEDMQIVRDAAIRLGVLVVDKSTPESEGPNF